MPRRLLVSVAAVTILAVGPLCAQAPNGAPPPDTGRSVEGPPATPQRAPHRRAAGDIDKAAKNAIRALDLQTELPKDDRLRIPVPAELIWFALACAAALLLYSLRDSLPFLRRKRDQAWETASHAPGEPARNGAIDALAAADTLSREGRFVEAMHVLLLQSLVEIRQQLGEQFADSLTSREILRGVRLPPGGRASLRDIVAAVERTYFGGYPAAHHDYVACRQSFDTLRLAMRGGATP